ncbi:hypothetical protein Mapa_015155 [Marchantia paleacea]|nr:hypothetical protein Mapa_015155 [Marchantia paleacea]
MHSAPPTASDVERPHREDVVFAVAGHQEEAALVLADPLGAQTRPRHGVLDLPPALLLDVVGQHFGDAGAVQNPFVEGGARVMRRLPARDEPPLPGRGIVHLRGVLQARDHHSVAGFVSAFDHADHRVLVLSEDERGQFRPRSGAGIAHEQRSIRRLHAHQAPGCCHHSVAVRCGREVHESQLAPGAAGLQSEDLVVDGILHVQDQPGTHVSARRDESRAGQDLVPIATHRAEPSNAFGR